MDAAADPAQRVTWSPAQRLAMIALRGYLIIVALLLIKAIQLGTG